MKPKNLIHIVPSNKWGEVQQYAFELCRHFKESGWNVTAMTRNALIVDNQFSAENIPLIHAPLEGIFDLDSIKVLAKKLRNSGTGKTVIHVHRYRDAFTAIMAAKLAKREDVKIVATRHKVREGRDNSLFRWLYGKIDTHIFISSAAYDRFRKSLGKRLSSYTDKIYILRYSLDGRYIPDTQTRPSGPFTFLYQGEIAPGNGLETLLDALGALTKRKFRIRIIGWGNPDYLDKLRTKAMKSGVMNSIDWGKRDNISIENARQAHCGLVMSTDGGSSLLSSIMFMAAGRPQICTSDGAQAEYLEDGITASVIPPGDPDRLGECLDRLASNTELCAEMGQKAADVYSRLLSWPHFINVINEIYDK